MKKVMLAVLALGILLVTNACVPLYTQRIDQPGYHAEGTNAHPPAPTTNEMDEACAELVRQGKASYVRTNSGVTCYVHDQGGEAGNTAPNSNLQHGVFENWANQAVNVSISDHTGYISKSFTIPAKSYYKIDLPPGEYSWQAQRVTGGETYTSRVSIDPIRGEHESQLAGGVYDFIIRIVPR